MESSEAVEAGRALRVSALGGAPPRVKPLQHLSGAAAAGHGAAAAATTDCHCKYPTKKFVAEENYSRNIATHPPAWRVTSILTIDGN